MLKHVILLCFLLATQAKAIYKPRMLSQDQIQICLAKDINDTLPDYLENDHQYLQPIIEIYNQTLAIKNIPSKAIKKWEMDDRGRSFRIISDSIKLLKKPYKSFLKQLIKDSSDIEEKYPLIAKKDILSQLYNDTNNLINNNIHDFETYDILQYYLARAWGIATTIKIEG